jgi:hypothetical protein
MTCRLKGALGDGSNTAACMLVHSATGTQIIYLNYIRRLLKAFSTRFYLLLNRKQIPLAQIVGDESINKG